LPFGADGLDFQWIGGLHFFSFCRQFLLAFLVASP
jgi:hypothetical protein